MYLAKHECTSWRLHSDGYNGDMDPLFEIEDVDREVYEDELAGFLPDRIIDIHTHVWKDELKSLSDEAYARTVAWPRLVAKENPVEDLTETYRLMFPGKSVTPLIFSSVKPGDDVDSLNAYIDKSSRKAGYPALLYSRPAWDSEELERRLSEGVFVGIKSYLDLSPSYIPRREIRIYDFFPPHQLEVIDRLGLIVMLHIPRDGRLRDPVNLAQMTEIDERYPNAHVIIAHVGRAYCEEDVGSAFEVLENTRNLVFDIAANTNAWVFEQLIRAVGPGRVLFGSDLPILRMRMKRICKDGRYVNIVPRGLYGDVSGDPNMAEVDGQEAETLTFFMYEELRAIKRAAEALSLSSRDLERIFFENSRELLTGAGFTFPD